MSTGSAGSPTTLYVCPLNAINTHTHTFTHTRTHTLTQSLNHTLTLTHTHSHTHSLTQSHTHTHSLTLTHTHTYTHGEQNWPEQIGIKVYDRDVTDYHLQSVGSSLNVRWNSTLPLPATCCSVLATFQFTHFLLLLQNVPFTDIDEVELKYEGWCVCVYARVCVRVRLLASCVTAVR